MVDKIKILKYCQFVLLIVLIIVFIYGIPAHITYAKAQSMAKTGLLDPHVYLDKTLAKTFPNYDTNSIRTAVENFIADNNYNVSVYMLNLRNGANFGINEFDGSFPASLNKLPLAILLIEEVEAGRFNLDTKISIDMSVIPDEYQSDITAEYYRQHSVLPLHTLIENMLQKSDNSAFWILISLVKDTDLTNLLDYFEIDSAGALDYGASLQFAGKKGPKSLANIFSSLYFSNVLEPENSEYLLQLLTKTTFDMARLAELPASAKVAHKYGSYREAKIFQDCGIIYYKKTRTLYCIAVRNQDEQDAISTTASIVNALQKSTAQRRELLNVFVETGRI